MSVPYFLLLTAYDLTHRIPNTCSQFYMQNLIYICNMQNTLYICLFYCIFRNKTQKERIVWLCLLLTALFVFLNNSTLAKDGLTEC